ncbi:MAG: tetratricopeptide repeat protein [Vicingaceae bacterium]
MKKTIFICSFLLLNLFFNPSLLAIGQPEPYVESFTKEYYLIRDSDLSKVEKIKKLTALYDSIGSKADSLIVPVFYKTIGNLYSDVGEYEKALKYYLISLRIYESRNDNKNLIYGYYFISLIHYQIDDYEKAIDYCMKALDVIKQVDNYSLKKLCNVYNLLANIYADHKVYDKAEYYFNEAIKQCGNGKLDDSSWMPMLKDNLAQLYENTDRIQLAIKNYEETLGIYLKNESFYDIAWNAHRLANAYSKEGNKEKALEYLNMAKEASTKMLYLDVAHDVSKTAVKLYSQYHMNDSLNHSLDQFFELTDSLVQAKITDNIQEAETSYQVEKKETALQLSQEKSARLDAEVSNQQLWLTVLLIVLAVLGGVSLFTYSYYRQKKKVAELELTVKEKQLDELLQAQESKAYAAMLRGQDQERERIAQDLHDRLGGTLAALKMSLRKPGNKVGDDDMEILNEAVQEVRSIAHNLSSGVMQKYGLNQAINQLKSTIEKSGGLKFQVFLHPKISILGQGVAIELYRVVQELVNNTIKHSGATEVSLQTNFDGETFNLIYEDNGKGFDPKKVKSGIGLENIKARVKRMNGSLHIDVEKGRGAIFIIELTKSNKA